MENMISDNERDELIRERYELALERIELLRQEQECDEKYRDYFYASSQFVRMIRDEYEFVSSGELFRADLSLLQQHNKALYEDILPDHYERSFTNPVYCTEKFGKERGQILAAVAGEMRGMIPAVYERQLEDIVIRLELLLQIYQEFVYGAEEGYEPGERSLRDILYWYVSDYSEIETEKRVADQVDPARDFALHVIEVAQSDPIRAMYYYGEFIGENQIQTAQYLATLDEAEVARMASVFTEGYRIGFEVTGRDLSIKKTVNIRYAIGFERMIKLAVSNFDLMGLKPTIYRAGSNIFQGRSVEKNGFFGENPNRQFDYDHREDQALILDGKLVQRKLETLKAAYERRKTFAKEFAGPAVLEVFGFEEFDPKTGHGEPVYSEKQQKLKVEYASKAGRMINEYIPGDERSFTIIAFPIPEIGESYCDIFKETIRINTLDYMRYRIMQQKIIDVLDRGSAVIVRGAGGNRTSLRIALHPLENPEKQTNFENCVADVNIPVGEVFTSPVLAGTEGTLHVSRVFLNGLEFRDLEIAIKDGMISGYGCGNFDAEEENLRYIRENILFHHETLPMGEFAIGTNTTAYQVGKKYGIEAKLPILIAEKTGPHFAFGDTCYSHCEDLAVYNPDGKEIIARENECSAKRSENPGDAYFNCHTDITIPFEELGEISVLTEEEEMIPIILDGRFVVAGCEELNEPLMG